MSKKKAKEFLEHLLQNKDAAEYFQDVLMKDMRDAVGELVKEGKIKNDDPGVHWPI